MALNVSTRLRHYDVTALNGEGGMGQVYRATDMRLGGGSESSTSRKLMQYL